MFKKVADIDKKKLLAKASDVKKDSLTRLKHFKTIIEHLEFNEIPVLFKSHYSFIYHTFIDSFSSFDCNSKQRLEDLDCLLFMLENILIHNSELIKKRWQFYSITFVMKKILHHDNIYRLREEGIRLFLLWYETLCDETNLELTTMFASIVPGLVEMPPGHDIYVGMPQTPQLFHNQQLQQPSVQNNMDPFMRPSQAIPNQNLPVKPSSIDPLVPISPNEPMPTDEISFYLDVMLQSMVTQITKPYCNSFEEAKYNQEQSFSFLFNMFKKVYLPAIFPDFNPQIPSSRTSTSKAKQTTTYSKDNQSSSYQSYPEMYASSFSMNDNNSLKQQVTTNIAKTIRGNQNFLSPEVLNTNNHHEYLQDISVYQSKVYRWITQILRQFPDQEKKKQVQRQFESSNNDNNSSISEHQHHHEGSNADNKSTNEPETHCPSEITPIATFYKMERNCREMEIARRVIGTIPENIDLVHELFRRAFLNLFQPESMDKVIKVYNEWISVQPRQEPNQAYVRYGYTYFHDLVNRFLMSSSHAFMIKVHNPLMLKNQGLLCLKIVNIHRILVMKIIMGHENWEQLMNTMLIIAENIFPVNPPEPIDSTIGGLIAKMFFQTFVVVLVRANLYIQVHPRLWTQFHHVMRNLTGWEQLLEFWCTTMNSVNRVLIRFVYGLNITDLPLERLQERRRTARVGLSLSQQHPTATTSNNNNQQIQGQQTQQHYANGRIQNHQEQPRRGSSNVILTKPIDSAKLEALAQSTNANHSASNQTHSMVSNYLFNLNGLTRSNSDAFMLIKNTKLYHSAVQADAMDRYSALKVRKSKSEYFLLELAFDTSTSGADRSSLLSNVVDQIDVSSNINKDTAIMLDSGDQVEPQSSTPGQTASSSAAANKQSSTSSGPRPSCANMADRCKLLGGTKQGWTDELATICWRRVLGLLGDINQIRKPQNHLMVMRCLEEVLCDLFKTRDNLGVSLDNQHTPEQPKLIPPYLYFSAWLFGAIHLPPSSFQESRLLAYKMLCDITIRRHDVQLPSKFYSTFYDSLVRGLSSNETETHSTILRRSAKLFSLELPGSSLLMQLYFERSRAILLNSPRGSSASLCPRSEAVEILGVILNLNKLMKKVNVFKFEAGNNQITTNNTKESSTNINNNNIQTPSLGPLGSEIGRKIFDTFVACNLRPTVLDWHTRSKTLFAMAIHCYQELSNKHECVELEQLIDILLREIQQPSCADMFRLSCDLLRLFADHSSLLINENDNKTSDPASPKGEVSLVTKMFIIMCRTVTYLVDSSSAESSKQALNCLLLCLEDWTISVGKSYLFSEQGENLLSLVLDSLENRDSAHSACKCYYQQIITYLDHFPLRQIGAASLSCCVNESDYDESNQLIMLAVDNSTLITLLGGPNAEAKVIVRNACGKYSWNSNSFDTHSITSSQDKLKSAKPGTTSTKRDAMSLDDNDQGRDDNEIDELEVDPDSFQDEELRSSMRYDSDLTDEVTSSSSMSSRSSTNRDFVFDLLNSLVPQNLPQNACGSHKRRHSAHSVSNPQYKLAQAEETMIALLTNQRFQELNHSERSSCIDRVRIKLGCHAAAIPSCNSNLSSPDCDISVATSNQDDVFGQCRQLLQQLGYLNWESRPKIECLAPSERLGRELKNLDAHMSRETHKIALVYVASGQEDKRSILSNSSSSRQFEEFVSALGWEVNLASHLGFMGGLQPNGSCGQSSQYFCSSSTEIMFHLSTRLISHPGLEQQSGAAQGANSGACTAQQVAGDQSLSASAPLKLDEESLNRKLRHLGNDEVHVVWCEHWRDYRRGIIATEFGDAIIVIYPMISMPNYFRIQLIVRKEVPTFGPLYDNCVVHTNSLASLVRQTAVNASRAKRARMGLYSSNLEQRNRLIQNIATNHKNPQSFEDFAIKLCQSKQPNHSQSQTSKHADQMPAVCAN